MAQKKINEKGNKYGLLTVIEETKDKNGRSAWLCRCECGNTKVARGSDLRSGRITTCGPKCKLKFKRSGVFIDETGNQYGKLTVIERVSNSLSNKTKWRCRCECGNTVDVLGTSLRQGLTLSCGCLNKEINSQNQFKNEMGNRYGKLTVIELVSKHPKAIWRCQCDCGRYVDVLGIYLRNGNTKSCGCLISWPECQIADWLTNNNISFEQQKSFSELTGINNGLLKFDFAIYKNDNLIGLIEYNGIQHTKPIEIWGGEKQLEIQRIHDSAKQKYCLLHNIPFLVINYNENTIEKLEEFIYKLTREV